MATNWTVVANQDSVDQVSAKIGESTDNETKATLFGKLWGIRNVVDWLKTNFTSFRASLTDARIAKLDNLDTKTSVVNATADAARLAAIAAQTAAGSSVIKSVQRGRFSTYVSTPNLVNEKTITISPVNTNKSFVILYALTPTGYVASSSDRRYTAYGNISNSTTITVNYSASGISSNSFNYEWQVIEFY